MKKILCLDGGGILGYLSARLLMELERGLPPAMPAPASSAQPASGNRFLDHFDLIAGTSTGSILASGLALGLPLQTIVDLYRERGRYIFKTGAALWADRAARVFSAGFSHPKHSDLGLATELRAAFRLHGGGDARLGDLRKPTLIPSFDASVHQPIVFKSAQPDHPSDLDLPLWEVVKSSCSAPSYFPSHTLRYQRASARESAMVDGGVFANNPTICALAELFSGRLDAPGSADAGDRDALVVSVGTSQQRFKGLSVARGRRMGLMDWALPLINIFMGGASLHVHGLAYRIIERDTRNTYVRFEIITDESLAIDQARPQDFARLDALLGDYLADFPARPDLAALHRENWYDFSRNRERMLAGFAG